jgi:hypothetical protein
MQLLADRVKQEQLLIQALAQRSQLEQQRAEYIAVLTSIGLVADKETSHQLQSFSSKVVERELQSAATASSAGQLLEP